ncbi:hypothetical protein OJAV_G00000160 [Oryzias javanicus]|uniref:GAT domain-containing protein n=1 Tax=Oryzias javanicus TaxID=123683 RepID=A0A3S2QAC5_ORYJA|nr:hypothetical protein OJAV_G00000160 [Oryzias javanicus]
MTDLDALSPIHTPNRSIPENGTCEVNPAPTPPSQPQAPAADHSQNSSPPVRPSAGPVSLSPEQEQKLQSDLALVRANLTVMSAVLNELTAGHSKPDDIQLLQQLYSVCKKMQARVVELIPQLLDEGFIEELLIINDDLNNAFIRYERFDRLNKAQVTNSQQSSAESPSLLPLSPQPSADKQPAVIATTSQPAGSYQSSPQQAVSPQEEEEFDMFAQTRSSSLAEQRKSVRYEDPGAVEGLAEALDSRLQVTAGAQPANNGLQSDIDRWLACDMQEDQSSVSEGVSSEEFDKFLEDRVKAVERSGQTAACSVPASTARPPPSGARQQGTSHDQLFSL